MQSVHMLRIRRASPAQLAAWTPGRDETNEFSSEDKADAEKPRQLVEAAARIDEVEAANETEIVLVPADPAERSACGTREMATVSAITAAAAAEAAEDAAAGGPAQQAGSTEGQREQRQFSTQSERSIGDWRDWQAGARLLFDEGRQRRGSRPSPLLHEKVAAAKDRVAALI